MSDAIKSLKELKELKDSNDISFCLHKDDFLHKKMEISGCAAFVALYYGITMGDKRIVEKLINSIPKKEYNLSEKYGMYDPLLFAIEKNNYIIVKLLINSGFYIYKHAFNRSPLIIAMTKDLRIFNILFRNVVNEYHFNILCDDDLEPLHYAVFLNNTDIIRKILNMGYNINAKDRHGQTPLVVAFRNNHYDAVKLLIQRGADIHAQVCYYIGFNLKMHRSLYEVVLDYGDDEMRTIFSYF